MESTTPQEGSGTDGSHLKNMVHSDLQDSFIENRSNVNGAGHDTENTDEMMLSVVNVVRRMVHREKRKANLNLRMNIDNRTNQQHHDSDNDDLDRNELSLLQRDVEDLSSILLSQIKHKRNRTKTSRSTAIETSPELIQRTMTSAVAGTIGYTRRTSCLAIRESESGRVFEFQESMYLLLLTEDFFSFAFHAASAMGGLSITCLILVVVNAFKDGTEGNPLSIPSHVSADVRVAQFLGMFIGVITEQESLQGILLLNAGIKSSLFLADKKVRLARLVLCALHFIVVGYLFIINLAFVVAKSSDVLSIFYDVLALEFVLNIDNYCFVVARRGMMGRRLQSATLKLDSLRIVTGSQPRSKFVRKFPFKAVYFMNLLGLLLWQIVVMHRQNNGYYTPNNTT